MKAPLEPLPYAYDALAPAISARTVQLHYEGHHRGYADKLATLLWGEPEQSLEDLIRNAEGELYDLVAQVWNHTFYWQGMSPDGGGVPTGMLRDVLEHQFGSFAEFKQELAEAANGEFGSGWAWLVRDKYGRLEVQKSSDAGNPLRDGYEPLLALDVWEHAYYLDYQNERGRYVQRFIDDLIDWGAVARRLQLPSPETVATWEAEERAEEEKRWGPPPDAGIS